MEFLYAVRAETLNEANALIEQTLRVQLTGGEGLHNGGEYFHFRQPNYSLQLRENIDLDDTELEFNGMHEPEFPEFKWLLYVWANAIPQDVAAALAVAHETFVRLRNK